jgi:hypothetical protein
MSLDPKRRLTWCLVKSGIDVNDPEAVIEPPETGVLEGFTNQAQTQQVNATYTAFSTQRFRAKFGALRPGNTGDRGGEWVTIERTLASDA